MDQHGADVPEMGNPEMTDLPIERRIPRAPACGWPPPAPDAPPWGHSEPTRIVLDRPTRKYLPTFAELVDRMTIVQLKQIWIPEHAAEYAAEIALIEHDLDLLLEERKITARHVRAIAVLMLTNRCIWESESKARQTGDAALEDLRFTHSINGVRNATKNVLSEDRGERKDWKIDALAADLPERFGNWRIWE
jgi:hypothetical protein